MATVEGEWLLSTGGCGLFFTQARPAGQEFLRAFPTALPLVMQEPWACLPGQPLALRGSKNCAAEGASSSDSLGAELSPCCFWIPRGDTSTHLIAQLPGAVSRPDLRRIPSFSGPQSQHHQSSPVRLSQGSFICILDDPR